MLGIDNLGFLEVISDSNDSRDNTNNRENQLKKVVNFIYPSPASDSVRADGPDISKLLLSACRRNPAIKAHVADAVIPPPADVKAFMYQFVPSETTLTQSPGRAVELTKVIVSSAEAAAAVPSASKMDP